MSMTSGLLTVPITERDHTLGRRNAPVTLVEYGDYECPYCGAAQPSVRAVLGVFENQLLFAYRHFPLTQIHPHAERAAEAAEAAGAQGRFWTMHELLFGNQHALDDEHLLQYANEASLDPQLFARDLAMRVHHTRVREDFMTGVRSGVNGTPTFFINGLRYNGSYDFNSLMKALQTALHQGPA